MPHSSNQHTYEFQFCLFYDSYSLYSFWRVTEDETLSGKVKGYFSAALNEANIS